MSKKKEPKEIVIEIDDTKGSVSDKEKRLIDYYKNAKKWDNKEK